MRIAVIGATGNVGTAVLRRLHRASREDGKDLEIVAISRRVPDTTGEPYKGVQWHGLDVGTDAGRNQLKGALAGADAVVHLAWAIQPNRDEDAMYRTNVTGTDNALHAAADAGVRQFVCASSVGAYSPASKNHPVDEKWPTGGISTSHYSRHKAAQERLLNAFQQKHPEMTVARLRPGIIFQADAGSEIGRYFLGPLIPKLPLERPGVPLLPIPDKLVFQAVHSDDVADAYWRVIDQRASGAFNIAADPVLTPARIAGLLGAKRVLNIPVPLLRLLVGASWWLHLQRTDPGWIDMGSMVPVMKTDRARDVLGWEPTSSSLEAMRSVLTGLSRGAGVPGSPCLFPRR